MKESQLWKTDILWDKDKQTVLCSYLTYDCPTDVIIKQWKDEQSLKPFVGVTIHFPVN